MTAIEFYRNVKELAGLKTDDEARRHSEAVCSALAMRLWGGEAKDFASQLPQPLKERVMQVTDTNVKWNLDEFLDYVQRETGADRRQAERSCAAVFAVLKRAETWGEVEDIISMLPKDLKEFFQAS